MDGSIPQMPPLATAGGEVALSVAVSSAGIVGAVDVLRSTPPFTETLLAAVRTWKFVPARDARRRPVDSRVLVDAVIGSPSLMVPTVGTPPVDVSGGDTRIPFPAQRTTPVYPVNARSEGSVLVEATVDASGHVVSASSIRSSPPFDGPALAAARSWTFRPAQGASAGSPANVYLLFVFRQPIMAGAAPAPVSK